MKLLHLLFIVILLAIMLYLAGCQIKYKESVWLDAGQSCQIHFYEKGKLQTITISAPHYLAVPSITELYIDDGLIHSIEDVRDIFRELNIPVENLMTYDQLVEFLIGKSM